MVKATPETVAAALSELADIDFKKIYKGNPVICTDHQPSWRDEFNISKVLI